MCCHDEINSVAGRWNKFRRCEALRAGRAPHTKPLFPVPSSQFPVPSSLFPLWVRSVLAVVLLASLAGCRPRPAATVAPVSLPTAPAALFQDVAARAGIHFNETNGATGKFYFIENT